MLECKKILENVDYINTVKKIEQIKIIDNGKWDWEHGLGHYKRVAEYVQKILKQLSADERTIELGVVAALLHDIGLSESGNKKTNHAIKSSELFRKFLVGTNITPEEEKILEHAIADHSNGNDIKSMVGLALVLADKLDVTYHRTENSSIQDEMNKEIQKIRSVDIEINDRELIVRYTTIDNFDINMLKNWEKAITIPKKIADYLNKNHVLIINDKEVLL